MVLARRAGCAMSQRFLRTIHLPVTRITAKLHHSLRCARHPAQHLRVARKHTARNVHVLIVQTAAGYTATLVAGEPIVENDALTGACPGSLVRGPQGCS